MTHEFNRSFPGYQSYRYRALSSDQILDDQGAGPPRDKVITRLPQMYKTSFSAITSPQRISRSPQKPNFSFRTRSLSPLQRHTVIRNTIDGGRLPSQRRDWIMPSKGLISESASGSKAVIQKDYVHHVVRRTEAKCEISTVDTISSEDLVDINVSLRNPPSLENSPESAPNLKRSISATISKFFKRLSPKSVRRNIKLTRTHDSIASDSSFVESVSSADFHNNSIPSKHQLSSRKNNKMYTGNALNHRDYKNIPKGNEAAPLRGQELTVINIRDSPVTPIQVVPPYSLNVDRISKSQGHGTSNDSIGDCSLGDSPFYSGSEGNDAVFSSVLESPVLKPASYLKLSCAVSGYSSYSSYKEKSFLQATKGDKILGIGSQKHLRSPDEVDTALRACLKKDKSVQRVPLNGNSLESIDSGTCTPSQDGHYFKQLLEQERVQLLFRIAKTGVYLHDEDISDDAKGLIRATIGKAQLLTTKKFKQFEGLCEKNLSQNEDEPFRTTNQDLAGFWDMVKLQIDDLDKMFNSVEAMKAINWQSLPIEVQGSATSVSPRKKSSSGKSSGLPLPSSNKLTAVSSVNSLPKSAKAAEAARVRQTARQKLLAAKRAGRKERKASQSENDDIEIFIA